MQLIVILKILTVSPPKVSFPGVSFPGGGAESAPPSLLCYLVVSMVILDEILCFCQNLMVWMICILTIIVLGPKTKKIKPIQNIDSGMDFERGIFT